MSATARLLKQRTADIHERVEAGLNLLDAALDGPRLAVVIARLAGFWAGTEPYLDAWAAEHPSAAQDLQWSRRRRASAHHADLDALGRRGDLAIAPPVFTAPDHAQVLGWLYVAEGSTLGGAVIERRLQGLSSTLNVRLTSFAPYPEGAGPMWRAYLVALEQWTAADDGRVERVVAASVATFGALEHWVSAIFDEAAA